MPRRSLVLLTLALASASPALADNINLIPGSTIKAPGNIIRGTVIAETPAEVTVKVGNTNQVVPVTQIASIKYDGASGTTILATSRESAGNYAEAADLYKKAAGEAAAKPFIAEDALFSQARVTADLGLTDPSKLDAAVTLLDAFIKAHGNGRHLVPALETLAKLQMQKGTKESYAEVELTIDRLTKIPQTADRAAVLRARVATRKGEHAAAIAELDKILADAPEGSVKRRDAQLAKAESLVALRKFADAEALVRGVIKGAPAEDSATQALAHNTLGDCLRAAGKPKEALSAYVHVDVLFSKEKDQHAKALSRIAQIWREIKRDDRADEAIDRLKQEYPKSPYVAAAVASKTSG
jgi:tetratricopeptide (TPR) repeat protein